MSMVGQLGHLWSWLWIFRQSLQNLSQSKTFWTAEHPPFIILDPPLCMQWHFFKTQMLATIGTEGKSHLGAVLGTEIFVHEVVHGQLQQWVEEIKHLSSTTQTQPHASYSAFVHVLSNE